MMFHIKKKENFFARYRENTSRLKGITYYRETETFLPL